MTIWFTADSHFDHENVIRYAKRPFRNRDHMNEVLIENWNSCVKPEDSIYHLGDIALCRPEKALAFISRLQGRKFWVFGNHDRMLRQDQNILSLFEWARDLAEITIPDRDTPRRIQPIVLCHFAMRVWNKSYYGAWQLYGHSHGSLPDDKYTLSLDVGVDAWNYRPVSYEEVKARMANKSWKPIDHHGRGHDEEEN